MERRSELIEGLIKSDPGYRPPPDYRYGIQVAQPAFITDNAHVSIDSQSL